MTPVDRRPPPPGQLRLCSSVPFAMLLLAGCGSAARDEPIDAAAAARGERIAESCDVCHDLRSMKNELGPPLVGIVGRAAASVSGYDYSAAMKASDVVWTPTTLVSFLRAPETQVPGTKMGGVELSERDASDVVEYLRSIE